MKNKKLWLLVGGIILVLVLAVTPLMAGCAKPAEEAKPPVEEKPPVEKPPVEKPPVEKPPVEKPPVEKPPVEPEFKLKFQMIWTPDHPAGMINDAFMDFIEEQSNGRVKFDRYYSGTLVDFFEFVPATSKGVLEVSDMLPDWTPATLDWTLGATRLWVEPSPYRGCAALGDIMKTQPRVIEEYKAANLHPLSPWAGAAFRLASTKPITGPEDIKGLKVFDQDCLGWEALGADCMFITTPELYDAMVKGLLDGMNNGVCSLEMFRADEVCDYITDVGEGSAFAMIHAVNLDTWNKLPPDIQKLFEEGSRNCLWNYHELLGGMEAKLVKKWIEGGWTVSRLPMAVRMELSSKASRAARETWVNYKPELAQERWEYLALVDAYLEKWRALPDPWKDPMTPLLGE